MNYLKEFVTNKYCFDYDIKLLTDRFTVEEIVLMLCSWLKAERSELDNITTFVRDLYLGVQTESAQKEQCYSCLVKNGFFAELGRILLDGTISEKASCIYTIGKFSHKENVGLLERSYESDISINHPILVFICLFELGWLGSPKYPKYIKQLKRSRSNVSSILLFRVFSAKVSSESRIEIARLLRDRKFVRFVCPDTAVTKEEDVMINISNFDQFVDRLLHNECLSHISYKHYSALAEYYFRNKSRLDTFIDSGICGEIFHLLT